MMDSINVMKKAGLGWSFFSLKLFLKLIHTKIGNLKNNNCISQRTGIVL